MSLIVQRTADQAGSERLISVYVVTPSMPVFGTFAPDVLSLSHLLVPRLSAGCDLAPLRLQMVLADMTGTYSKCGQELVKVRTPTRRTSGNGRCRKDYQFELTVAVTAFIFINGHFFMMHVVAREKPGVIGEQTFRPDRDEIRRMLVTVTSAATVDKAALEA